MSDGSASHPQASREHIGIWWDLFYNKVQPSLNAAMKKIQKARKKCENDEALDVGRIVLDNKLQTGDSSEASAQQQVNNKKRKEIILTKWRQKKRRDFQCDGEEQLEEEMEETLARSTILSSLVEVLPGTFAFDWFGSESPKHVSQSQCASAENNTRIVTKECLEKEQYDTPSLCFVFFSPVSISSFWNFVWSCCGWWLLLSPRRGISKCVGWQLVEQFHIPYSAVVDTWSDNWIGLLACFPPLWTILSMGGLVARLLYNCFIHCHCLIATSFALLIQFHLHCKTLVQG